MVKKFRLDISIRFDATHERDGHTDTHRIASRGKKLISSSTSKTSQLDTAPTWLVKEFRTLLSPFIRLLLNQSLATGCFPRNYGQAIVLPLLKKNNLDAIQPKNSRPVSNLCYLSKLLETVVQKQLQQCLDEHDAMPTHQSAYRKYHSTETAVLKLFKLQ